MQSKGALMDRAIANKFNDYPEAARLRLLELRSLILKLAEDLELGKVEETLKWDEPSYSVKNGSPVRIDWKLKSPNHYYLFFNCNTKLVDTFRERYGDELQFQGNRAIVLHLSEDLPQKTISHCIELALTYKKRKHLPLLGL